MPGKLTTTSYAILGHLAMKPWTMYELAAQMRRNVHYFYPRAESQVYAEPKRLAALGLATAETLATGRRTRTVYTITPAGRRALTHWLAARVGRGPLLEFEGLLRVFLAPFGSDENLAATLEQVRAEIGGLLGLSGLIREEYLAGQAPFLGHAPTRAIVHDFLTHFGELVDAWGERSLQRLREWERMSEEERQAAALEIFRQNPIRRRLAPAEGRIAGKKQPAQSLSRKQHRT